MQQINLIDPRLIPQRQWLPVPLLVGVCVAAVAIVAGHYLIESAALKQVMAAAAVSPSSAATASPTSTPSAASAEGAAPLARTASSAAAESAALQTRIATLEALRAGSRSQSQLPRGLEAALNAIVASLSDRIWLTEIDIGPDGSLRISGGTLDASALRDMTQRLSQVAALKGTRIGVLRIEPWQSEAAASSDGSAATSAAPGHRFVLASLGHAGSEDAP